MSIIVYHPGLIGYSEATDGFLSNFTEVFDADIKRESIKASAGGGYE